MAVRKLKPITPGQRFKVVNGFDAITASKPEKSLLAPLKKSGGRNSDGKMTASHRGGGHKRRYRIIDFKRTKEGAAEVLSIEYDPNRTAFIALVQYADGEKRYVIAQNGLEVGHLDKGEGKISGTFDYEPKSAEEIIELLKIDTDKWKLSQYWNKQMGDHWRVSALISQIAARP